MDIAREICTDSFYTVNGGLPRVPLTAVVYYLLTYLTLMQPSKAGEALPCIARRVGERAPSE